MGIKRKIKHAMKPHKKMTLEKFKRKFDKAIKQRIFLDVPKAMIILKDKTSLVATDYKTHTYDGITFVDLIYEFGGQSDVFTVPLDDIIDVY